MDGSGRRRTASLKTTVVAAGSVWESRMKLDQVKGGIKVFNGDSNPDDTISDSPIKSVKKPQIGVSGKRKTWKSESFDGSIQIGKAKDSEEQSRELSVSVDGIKIKSSNQARKALRSEKNPIQIRKPRSEIKVIQSGKDIGIDNGFQLKKPKSEPEKASDEPVSQDCEIGDIGSEESCKEFGVCQENAISNEEDAIEGDEEEEEEEEKEIEIEIEKKSLDIVEFRLPEEKKPLKKVDTKSEEEKKPLKKVEISRQEEKKVENEEKRVYQFRNRAAPTSSTFSKQTPPLMGRAEIYENLEKSTKPASSSAKKNEFQNFPETHNKLQNLVDLVMWRDISRSAFVFGIGAFIIISSSYTKDLNVSFISVISYLGLVYLAAIFLYRSLICRGVTDIDDTSYVLGEEEAIWLLKLFLPYLNECLLKIKALFSGDPATTMKLAVLLFVFARCGSCITIWKMAKLGFFGVFTVPKVCSSYSTQLTAYAKFWIRRFRDAWESCTHKKAVALAIFTLVWNLSSMVARVWAVFFMFVAVRYYQQSDDWTVEEEEEDQTLQGQNGPQKHGLGFEGGPTPNRVKKGVLK